MTKMEELASCVGVDKILTDLGFCKRYHLLHVAAMMWSIFAVSASIFGVIFLGKYVDHRCIAPETPNFNHSWNESDHSLYNVTYEPCRIVLYNGSDVVKSESCVNGYEYSSGKHTSYASEWDLVCDREFLSDFSQTLLACGALLGSIVFPSISDRCGRKPVYLTCNTILLVITVILGFSPSYNVFAVGRFIAGAATQGLYLTTIVYMLELFPSDHRTMGMKLDCISFAIFAPAVAGIAYLARNLNWRYTQVILAVSSINVLAQLLVTSESIRWLLATGQLVKAEQVIRRAAKMNKLDADKVLDIKTEIDKEQHTMLNSNDLGGFHVDRNDFVKGKTMEMCGISVFWKNKKMLFLLCTMTYTLFTHSVMYYGLMMMSESLADDLYLGFFLYCVTDVPVAILFCITVGRMRRKQSINVFLGMSVAALVLSIVLSADFAANVPGRKVFLILLPIIGKLGVTVSYTSVYILTPEVFPTPVRNTGLGIAALGGSIGAMIAPFSRTFSRHVPWGPGALFCILSIGVLILLRFVPNTEKHRLQQRVEDFDEFFKGDRNKKRKMEDVDIILTNDVDGKINI